MRAPRFVGACCAAVLWTPAVVAQYSPYIPTPPPQQQSTMPQQPSAGMPWPMMPTTYNTPQSSQMNWQRRTVFDPIWTPLPTAPTFQGFPVAAARMTPYGTYPTGAGVAPVPLLPPVDKEDPGWPGWLRLRGEKPLPFASDVGLLVRHCDRVWWRNSHEDAFVPLYHHDKLGTLGVGAEVQVRQAGEFEVLLHESTRLIARGPTDLALVTLSPAKVEVEFRTFTWLRLQVRGREHSIALPDGSRLWMEDDPAAVVEKGPALVMLRRADEPGRYGGRATIFNAGGRTVVWKHAFGEVKLEPGNILTMFLLPSATAIPAPVVATKAQQTPDGDALRFAGQEEGRVSWCGAAFDLGPGRTVRLDPVLGRPFAPPANGPTKQ